MTAETQRHEEYRLIIGQYSNETKIGTLERLQDERDSLARQLAEAVKVIRELQGKREDNLKSAERALDRAENSAKEVESLRSEIAALKEDRNNRVRSFICNRIGCTRIGICASCGECPDEHCRCYSKTGQED